MFVGICEATFRAEWVSSLKEKRMVVKSLVEKTRHKFNASVAEVDRQEEHKMLVVGFACVSNEKAMRSVCCSIFWISWRKAQKRN